MGENKGSYKVIVKKLAPEQGKVKWRACWVDSWETNETHPRIDESGALIVFKAGGGMVLLAPGAWDVVEVTPVKGG